MAENELWIKLMADINDVQNKLNTLQTKSISTSSSMTSSFSSAALKIGAALGIAFSVRTIINFAKTSTEAFANSEYSAMALANTLKNIGISNTGIKSIENLVTQLEKTKFFDDAEIRTALSNTVIKLGNLDLATKTVTTAMEVARAKNIDLSDAVQRLSLGLLGNSRGLKDLGINIKDYNAETIDAATQTKILNDVMLKVAGSTQTYATTTKGALEKSTTAWQNFKEAVGQALEPFTKMNAEIVTSGLNKITDALNAQSLAANELSKRLQGVDQEWDAINMMWIPSLKKATINANDLANEILPIYSNLSKVEDAAGKFKAAWSPITLQGGNIPELARFVGNLGMMKPQITKKVIFEVNINDVSQSPTFISHRVAAEFKREMAYESHGSGGG